MIVLAAIAPRALTGMPPAPYSVEVARTAVFPVTAEPRTPAVCEPNEVVLPELVTTPDRLALVVTLPAVRFAAVPDILVPTKADGVPSAGVTRVGEVPRTTSPVPVHVNKEEVARLAASAVEPVMFASTELAETWARFANGRSPVTPVVSGRPVALVRTNASGVPSHELPDMVSWVVEALPKVAPPTALNWPVMVDEPVTANADEVAEVKVAALKAEAVVPVAVM